jgi:hypothetical protein
LPLEALAPAHLGREVDDEFELGWLFHRKIGRDRALEDAIHVILDRGQHSGDRGQQLPSTASRQRITELNAARKMDKDIATTSLKFQLQTGGQQ